MGYQQLTDASEAPARRQHEGGEPVVVTTDDLGLVLQQIPHKVQPRISLLSSFPVKIKKSIKRSRMKPNMHLNSLFI